MPTEKKKLQRKGTTVMTIDFRSGLHIYAGGRTTCHLLAFDLFGSIEQVLWTYKVTLVVRSFGPK